ncbi:adenylosuccinate synthetase [Candidatus Pacearchaeota archaeon]|nr:adenylosuccinate synthetase [Candidatus Pacearchaeota archaeon]
MKILNKMSTFIRPGEFNILIDGQFGSTGKGLVASYIGNYNHVDIAVTNASPNAAHTYYDGEEKYVTHHLPISGILNKRSTMYLCAGAIIDPEILLRELQKFQIMPERLCIHPRAAVINHRDIEAEQYGSVSKIASTRKGVGQALIRKINRESGLAKNHPLLNKYVKEIDLNWHLDQGCNVLMEVPQGFDLSINSGLSYPHCTSREITVSGAMSDAQVHPRRLGNVIVVIRTYPIRVGHLIEDGIKIGDSGPFYDDSVELTWDDVGVPPEYTTNTNRVRRVCSFSMMQYKRMMSMLEPTHIFLNFANYMNKRMLNSLLKKLPEVTHLGFGPTIDDIEVVL